MTTGKLGSTIGPQAGFPSPATPAQHAGGGGDESPVASAAGDSYSVSQAAEEALWRLLRNLGEPEMGESLDLLVTRRRVTVTGTELGETTSAWQYNVREPTPLLNGLYVDATYDAVAYRWHLRLRDDGVPRHRVHVFVRDVEPPAGYYVLEPRGPLQVEMPEVVQRADGQPSHTQISGEVDIEALPRRTVKFSRDRDGRLVEAVVEDAA